MLLIRNILFIGLFGFSFTTHSQDNTSSTDGLVSADIQGTLCDFGGLVKSANDGDKLPEHRKRACVFYQNGDKYWFPFDDIDEGCTYTHQFTPNRKIRQSYLGVHRLKDDTLTVPFYITKVSETQIELGFEGEVQKLNETDEICKINGLSGVKHCDDERVTHFRFTYDNYSRGARSGLQLLGPIVKGTESINLQCYFTNPESVLGREQALKNSTTHCALVTSLKGQNYFQNFSGKTCNTTSGSIGSECNCIYPQENLGEGYKIRVQTQNR